MEKEKVFESTRTKAVIVAVLVYLFSFGADYLAAQFGWQLPAEQIAEFADKVAVLIVAWVAQRTYRNTPSK